MEMRSISKDCLLLATLMLIENAVCISRQQRFSRQPVFGKGFSGLPCLTDCASGNWRCLTQLDPCHTEACWSIRYSTFTIRTNVSSCDGACGDFGMGFDWCHVKGGWDYCNPSMEIEWGRVDGSRFIRAYTRVDGWLCKDSCVKGLCQLDDEDISYCCARPAVFYHRVKPTTRV